MDVVMVRDTEYFWHKERQKLYRYEEGKLKELVAGEKVYLCGHRATLQGNGVWLYKEYFGTLSYALGYLTFHPLDEHSKEPSPASSLPTYYEGLDVLSDNYREDAWKRILCDNPIPLFYKINDLAKMCYTMNRQWYIDPITKAEKPNDFPKSIALIHSELSEALEGHRTGAMSKKNPLYTNVEEELADAIIRILDLAGSMGLKLGAAMASAMDYNATRSDHSLSARAAKGGKRY